MHITSLHSRFGVGNLGPEARKFVDFLSRSHQYYWQLLPLNPVGREQAYSPYSSISSMAGNVLLISPEELAEDGLIEIGNTGTITSNGKVNFLKVQNTLGKILQTAYLKFSSNRKRLDDFQEFCQRESYWLDDFANFVVIKKYHNNAPWFAWPKPYKQRNGKAIRQFVSDNASLISYTKWLQYLFFSQWHRLKSYANEKGIQMFGDLPFYVSYDSADVWSHPEIFNIDKKGNMTGVAGVPPDYFSADGQLWGIPLYDWPRQQRDGFRFWLTRVGLQVEAPNAPKPLPAASRMGIPYHPDLEHPWIASRSQRRRVSCGWPSRSTSPPGW